MKRAGWTADRELGALMGADPGEEPFVSAEDELRRNEAWMRGREEAGDALYAIEVEGQTIGDVDVFFPAGEDKAEFTVFIGERSARSKGYGSESVELVLEELAAAGRVRTVDVDVPKGNERALRFWERQGFELYATDDGGRRWLRKKV